MGINMRQWAGEKILKPEDVKNKPRREQIAVVRPPAFRQVSPAELRVRIRRDRAAQPDFRFQPLRRVWRRHRQLGR